MARDEEFTLESLLPPGYGPERRRRRPPGAEQRKKPRITIQEINTRGLEAVKELRPDVAENLRKGRPWWKTAIELPLDFLDLPRNAVARIIGGIAGVDVRKLARGSFGERKVFVKDILEHAGMKPGIARTVLGIAGDIAIDPLTYLTVGAITGLKVAKHAPRILRSGVGMLRQVARTRRVVDPLLRKALGEGVEKLLKAAPKTLMRRRGGLLTQRLAQNVLRGDAVGQAARQWFRTHGLRGRPLFRIPFTEVMGPTIRRGAAARAYRAMAPAAGEARKLGRIQALAGLERVAAPGAREIGRMGREMAEHRLAARAAGAEVTPAALKQLAERRATIRQTVREMAEKAGIRARGRKLPQIGRVARRVRIGEVTRPEAPEVVKLAQRALLGPSPRVGTWQWQLQKFLGPRTGLLRAQELAIRHRHGLGASQEMSRVFAEMQPAVDRVVAGIAKAEGVPTKQARRMLFNVLDIGGDEGLRALHRTDEAHRLWAAGLNRIGARPEVRSLADDIAASHTQMREALERMGIRVPREEEYLHRLASREAAPYFARMTARKGMKDVASAFEEGRARLHEILNPAGEAMLRPGTKEQWLELSTSLRFPQVRARIREAGGVVSPTGFRVSAAHMEKLARTGGLAKVLGPEYVAEVAARGAAMWQADPATAVAARAAANQRAMAVQQLKQLAAQGAVPLTEEQLARPLYAGLRQLSSDNPFGQMLAKEMGVGAGQRLAFPEPVAAMLDRFADIWRRSALPAKKGPIWFWDRLLSLWKWQALYHPSYVTRNRVNEAMMVTLVGLNPLGVFQDALSKPFGEIVRAAARFRPERVTGSVTVGGLKLSRRRLVDDAIRYNFIGGASIAHFAPETLRGAAPAQIAVRRAGRRAQQAAWAMRRVESAASARVKVATYARFLSQGVSPIEAAERTILALPDMTNLPNWARGTVTRVYPWSRWAWNNGLNHLLYWLPTMPIWMQVPAITKRVIEGMRGRPGVPEELRPDWMREQIGAQFAGGPERGMAFLLKSWFPQEEALTAMGSVFHPSVGLRYAVTQSPALKFAAEQGLGVEAFRRRPVEQRSTLGMVREIPAALAGRSAGPLGNILGIRPIKEYTRRVWEQPTTTGRVARALMGGAIQPLEAERGLRERDIQTRARMGLLRRRIVRAKESGDQVELRELLRQFMLLLLERRRLGLPIARASEQALARAGI